MRLAKAHMEKNEYDAARAQIDNALQINITNHEAYYYLGLIQEAHQQFRAAQQYYSRSLEYYPDYLPSKTSLARVLLKIGQTSQAADNAKAVLISDPENTAASSVLAEVKASGGSFGKAIEDLERARAKGATSLDMYKELVSLYLRQNNFSQAELVLLEAIRQYPQNLQLQEFAVQVYEAGDRPSRAEIPLKAIIALEPGDFGRRAKLVSHYILTGNHPEAEATLRASISVAPLDVKRILALTEFLLRYRSPETAQAELRGFIQANPKSKELRFALADLYEASGLSQDAEQIYLETLAQKASDAESEIAHVNLAQIYMAMGKASVAKTHANNALRLSKHSPVPLATRGKIAFEERDLDQAVADFRLALKMQPNSIEYIGLLARAYVQNRQPGLARELLSSAVKNHPSNYPVRMLLVEHMLNQRDYKNALAEVTDAINFFPFDQELQKFRSRIIAMQKKLPVDLDAFTASEIAVPTNAAAIYREGTQFLEQKKYDDAIGEFQKAHRIAPISFAPMQGLVQAYLAQGRPDRALSFVTSQLSITSPVLHYAYFLLAQIYANQGRSAEAIRAYQQASYNKPYWDAPHLALAQHYYARQENRKALAVLEAAVRLMPDNQTVTLHLAGILELDQNVDRAITEYEKLLKQDPSHALATNNLAVLLLEKRSDKESIERALKLARRFQNSNRPEFLDTLGWALAKNGDAGRALPFLEKALLAMPDAANVHYHAGMIYMTLGDTDKAKTHLLKSIAAGVESAYQDKAKAVVATL
ncbi:MAG: tetratricopeptide repeat protein [Burkholderiales bacterium]